MSLPILHPQHLDFPPVQSAESDGLLAVGGDLSVPRLLRAYRSGIFPWSDAPLTWWSPDPRAIFAIDTFATPPRLQRKMNEGKFHCTFDRAFHQVIAGCAEPKPGREETWISSHFLYAYRAMHHAGYAHSTEIWLGDKLVGGLYGVAIGGFFAGESMFHRESDASKIALCVTMQHLRTQGFVLFDTQVLTPITVRLGALEIPRADYLPRLRHALAMDIKF